MLIKCQNFPWYITVTVSLLETVTWHNHENI